MITIRDKGTAALCLSNLEPRYRTRSSFHRIEVYLHPHLGHVLMVDGEIQHVEVWSPLYHEPLIHLPCAFLREPKSALILGGGSLFAAAEILKYPSLERVLMVDHDPEIIDAVSGIYKHASTVLQDSRLEIVFEDAFKVITSLTERFDLVINDSVDLLTLGKLDVLKMLDRLLLSTGICSDLIYRHIFETKYLQKALTWLSQSNPVLSLVFVPEYPGVLHLLTLWGKNLALKQDLKFTLNKSQMRWEENPPLNPCKYFDPRFLAYYLHLPRVVRTVLDKQIT